MNNDLANDNKIVWSALEHEHRERSPDWFWALGIIVFTAGAAAIIYGNYFFAIFLIISGLIMAMYAIKRPEIVSYELNSKGFGIKNRLFPYQNIKSFWIQTGDKPLLFIKTSRLFMPIIPVPIDNSKALEIKDFMINKQISEEEIKEHPSEKIMDFLGF